MTNVAPTITNAGAQPTPPGTLYNNLVSIAQTLDPGLTANLPLSLIEDIASTSTGALSVIDSGVVDLINSIAPTTANTFVLNQLGQTYGVQQGQSTNGSVYVVFTGTAGYLIPPGFQVSDGSHTFTVQDGGIIASGGQSAPLYCTAVQSGTFAIPANSVTTIATSLPLGATLTCNNPLAGTPSTSAETPEEYRAIVLQAGMSAAQGMPAFVKTQLAKVAGVQPQLVSMQQNGASWTAVVGGGDPYEVAGALYRGMFDINNLVGSQLQVTGITNANPGVVTTNIAHGLTTGTVVTITGTTGISGINGVPFTITVMTPYKFSLNGHNTTGSGAWTSGGTVSPNVRNQSVSISDYPNTYVIPFVTPLQQIVAVACTWATISVNLISPSAISSAVTPAIINYINSIATGQPINLLALEDVFNTAVAPILPTPLISALNFGIQINGITVTPGAGLTVIYGDAFSYFFTTTANVTVVPA
jgi:hypothetical protein